MLIYFVICVLPIGKIHFLNAEDAHNAFVKGGADYKIEYSVGDDDIESISKDELIPYKIKDKVNKFNELNKMCKREYYRTIRSKSLVHRYYKGLKQHNLCLRLIRNNGKSSTSYLHTTNSRHLQHRRQLGVYDEAEYDYDSLIEEYYVQAKMEEKSNDTYHEVKIDPNNNRMFNILSRIFKLNTETEDQASYRQSRDLLTDRLWKMSQIWLLIYLFAAIPLWCTLGWCCCCLCCKSLKAHETIDDARRYMVWNPPGILRDNSSDILYEPSKKEIETYEELEHLIKTL